MTSNPFHGAPDANGFKLLFDSYVQRVQDYIYAITRSRYMAEEATQELFIILWRKRYEWPAIQNMDHYIFRIARNLAINLLKKAAHNSRLADEWYRRSLRKAVTTTDELQLRHIQQLIHQAVSSLPPQPQKVYLLSRQEQMSFEEIAKALQLSRNTVRNHLNRALNAIREHLIQNGYHPLMIVALSILHCSSL